MIIKINHHQREKFAADQRARKINRALARRSIQKFAGLAENGIRLAPQYSLALPGSGELFLRRLKIDPKLFRQPLDVARGHLHALVYGAAVRRTFSTVVVASGDFGSGHPWVRWLSPA